MVNQKNTNIATEELNYITMEEEKFIGNRESKKPKFEFKELAMAQEYLEWKEVVPIEVRRQVEAVMKNNIPVSSQIGLVLSDQFLNILGEYLLQKRQTDLSGVDKRVSNLLAPLERIETKSGYLN